MASQTTTEDTMGSRKRRREQRAVAVQPRGAHWSAGIGAWIRTTIIGWLPAIAIFSVTRVALAEANRIPSGSMEPTLLVGDWLFVNKLRFGPHIPFTSH